MRIGELSERTGVSRRSLRYYEEQGLLVSTRSPSGQRLYAEDQVQRVRLIQSFFAAGLSSRTIVEMLPCMTTRPTMRAAQDSMAVMRRERERLSATLDTVLAALAALDRLIDENSAYQARLTGESSARQRASTTTISETALTGHS
ncbi:MerR family transcriptional regulator [Actinoallomurus spadix]|uniref:MerR family transcriptional regulator n=1 Tax=Actinoallomurus spadix TaxID=79912 RepID=A0ABN0W9Z6_9ACTN|nr:MerR family transcriptional regulator [Actinoallomurus spadix]MCO5990706.1 MerR family transcriptional regulator [Actinoallomurus spadix]